jgi:dihydropteroate synthase
MGVLNVTPDSFSDGGRYASVRDALERGREMVAEGAAIVDVGGESTRPGAPPVGVEEELRRVLPVVEALAAELPVPLSIDTSKPEVIRRAVAAGAGLINDVRALRAPGALEAAVRADVPVCLMHMQGEPGTMQAEPRYDDVVGEVVAFLEERVAACERAGIPRAQVLIDPGFGFGKTAEHNLRLLNRLDRIAATGLPVLVGLSRKSLIGKILDAPVDRRLYGSLAAAVVAVMRGARVVRTHDVRATVEALAVVRAVTDVS